MKRNRRLLLSLSGVVFALAFLAGAAWLRYGEAVLVLRDLLQAPPGFVAADVTRLDVTVGGEGPVTRYYQYEVAGKVQATLLLVPGLTSAGREDSRVTAVSGVLAQAGFRTVVPDLPGAVGFRTDEDDILVLEAIVDHLAGQNSADDLPLVVVAISYGQGPALVALSRDGRADALSVVRFTTTGAVGRGPEQHIEEPDPLARWILLMANAPLVSSPLDRAELMALAQRGFDDGTPSVIEIATVMAGTQPDAQALLGFVANTDPERVDALLSVLSPELREGVVAVSPVRHDLSGLEGKIMLVHGDADMIVPLDESRRLADAVKGTELFLISGFSHVEPEKTDLMGQITMIRAVAALLETRALP
ncbi:MAG: alpha/beta hydrolase [Alphaproteobacteria bacterium]|nr:alpha/beta hydrolase [Rhodospirillaceae bacterium]MDG2479724.1 alpha/beta hydrolase [Alphaproteobacteria bacterium]MBT6205716.1 alpha/beta hydrolase [Rhodospirillaceae bacterium]MBT6509502.1 alpha/beta hydrolase [Rhodospirillaceae bacterium]MBT7615334.1 alpha/beta hydrolase [Rhodospirillaceae bacterium]